MDHEFVARTKEQRPKIRETYEFNEDLQIGRGSYGVVYKIHQKNDKVDARKYYALKVIELLPYSPSACREISVRWTATDDWPWDHSPEYLLILFFWRLSDVSWNLASQHHDTSASFLLTFNQKGIMIQLRAKPCGQLKFKTPKWYILGMPALRLRRIRPAHRNQILSREWENYAGIYDQKLFVPDIVGRRISA